MISQRPATHCRRATLTTRMLCLRSTDTTGDFTGRPKRLQFVSEQVTLAPWMTAWRVVAWVCLIIIIIVAVGRALQVGAETLAARGEASELAQPMQIVYAQGACPALDRYGHRTMTIDELDDLQNQLCPTMSQRPQP
jgi:hypothetical protein